MRLPAKYLKRWADRVVRLGEDACWDWSGYKLPTGYGAMSVMIAGKRLTLYAHRLAYEAVHGPIPEGYDVRHTCHNPSCSNPKHLLIGTRRENMQDAKEAGRRLGRPPKLAA